MATIDEAYIERVRLAHGIIAAMAWVVFLPAGAISIRLIPGRMAVYIHAVSQIAAYALFVSAAGLGIHLALYIGKGGTKVIATYHPVIGLVAFSLAFFQPILGFAHHTYFKKIKRRTFWTHAHLWLGRILITLAMINGGLGLKYSAPYQPNHRTGFIVYGVFAGIIWCIFVAAAIFGEVQKARTPPATPDAKSEITPEQSIGSDEEKLAENPSP